MLVDAGAEPTLPVRISDAVFADTPLDLTTLILQNQSFEGRKTTKEQLLPLEAIRRLLLRVEAAEAVSSLGCGQTPPHPSSIPPRIVQARPVRLQPR